jgi:chromosome partitioning protein
VKTLGVFSSKGGTGKTTIALHLAVNASAAGLKVLIADLDPQRSAMAWQTERRDRGVQVILPMPNKLREWQFTATERGFDLMIVDTPPLIGPHTLEALKASHFALAVTRTNALDIWAMAKIAELFQDAGKPAAFVLNQVPSPRLGQELAATTAAVEQLKSYGVKVAPVGLRQRVIYAASTAQGQCAQELDPTSIAAREVAMLFDYVWDQMKDPSQS